jgi:hypothetical protein
MNSQKYFGIIEGFYGQPWSHGHRQYLLHRLRKWNLDSYFYAPKFDLYHRLHWQLPYPPEQIENFRDLAEIATKNNIRFIFSISPGLSYKSDMADNVQAIYEKLRAIQDTGVNHFGLCMDDIPYENADGLSHARLANEVASRLNASGMFFCPTAYSDWHFKIWEAGRLYLENLGKNLDPAIQIFWTGPSIISRHIQGRDLDSIRALIHRNPVIWDNYLNNDYLPASALFCGPISGRSSDLINMCNGHFLNPSRDFHLSLPPIITFGEYIRNPVGYNPDTCWNDLLSSTFKKHSRTIATILGYFYTPFSTSHEWMDRINRIVQFLSGRTSDSQNLCDELADIHSNLHQDDNLVRYGKWWEELFPHVQTLHGDIEYVLNSIKLKNLGISDLLQIFPNRDPRWSTPLESAVLKNIRELSIERMTPNDQVC